MYILFYILCMLNVQKNTVLIRSLLEAFVYQVFSTILLLLYVITHVLDLCCTTVMFCFY